MTKLDDKELTLLRDLQYQVQHAEACLAADRATLNLKVLDLFRSHGVMQGQYSICINCGNFFLSHLGCKCFAGDG